MLSNLRVRVLHSSPMFAKGAGVDVAQPREIRERPAHPNNPKKLLEGEDPTIRKRNCRKATSTTAMKKRHTARSGCATQGTPAGRPSPGGQARRDFRLEMDLLTSPVLAMLRRDSSTSHPDPEIEKADFRGRIKRRDAPLRMTTCSSEQKNEEVNKAIGNLKRGTGGANSEAKSRSLVVRQEIRRTLSG